MTLICHRDRDEATWLGGSITIEVFRFEYGFARRDLDFAAVRQGIPGIGHEVAEAGIQLRQIRATGWQVLRDIENQMMTRPRDARKEIADAEQMRGGVEGPQLQDLRACVRQQAGGQLSARRCR